MELLKITSQTAIAQLLKNAWMDINAMEVNNAGGDERVADQRVYAAITLASFLYKTFPDEQEIERNIQWTISAEASVWIDQQVCKETGQVICARLDVESLGDALSSSDVSLFLDDAPIEDFEIQEIPLLQEYRASLSRESLQKAIDEIYIAKCNMPCSCIVEAAMKDNGEAYIEYYRVFSTRPLQAAEDYEAIMKSLAFDSPYGPCFDAARHIDTETGLLKTPYSSILIGTSEIDFDLGYSLIGVKVLKEESSHFLRNDGYQLKTHIFERHLNQIQP